MDLKIKDLVRFLNVPERTVLGWIREKKIPVYRIHHQYRFDRAEISEWALASGIASTAELAELTSGKTPVDIVNNIRAGGVFYHVAGTTVHEVLRNAVDIMPLPHGIDKALVASQLIEREELMPTAVGKGIAIPHPRRPVMTDIGNERCAIIFPEHPINFKARDGIAVHVFFITLSANHNRHLEMLSRIAYLCRNEVFAGLLKNRASMGTILSYIETAIKPGRAA
ncbi:MAG: PTS sugar transporter subunit IIA [Spirochaetes bacterium]|nr:PTS sugar transporter subunit IIA [Spirochaetota bacterium]